MSINEDDELRDEITALTAKLAEVTAERDAFARACGEMDRMQAEALVAIGQQRKRIETALAASQAHAVELRAAGKELEELLDTADLPNGASLRRLRTAVARESSTDALLEFGVRCIQLWEFGGADGDVPDDLNASMEQTALAALERR